MQAEGLVYTALLLEVVHDIPGAVADLLALLEAEVDLAGELLLVLGEDPGGAEQHGGVGVVAAGVHAAVNLRLEGHIGLLMHRQGIDVPAHGDGLARAAGVDQADHIGLGDPHIGDPHLVQLLADAPAGPDLLVGELRMAVELMAQVDHIVFVLLCFLMDIEHCLSVLCS